MISLALARVRRSWAFWEKVFMSEDRDEMVDESEECIAEEDAEEDEGACWTCCVEGGGGMGREELEEAAEEGAAPALKVAKLMLRLRASDGGIV